VCAPWNTVARLEQFTILLENIQSLEDATGLPSASTGLTLPFTLGEHDVYCQYWHCLNTTDYDNPDMLRDADITMYRAKAQVSAISGIDRTMHTQAMALLHLETDLRRALERQNSAFTTSRLYRSPAVGLAVLRPCSAGSIHNVGLFPVEFIPVAEETGLSPLAGGY